MSNTNKPAWSFAGTVGVLQDIGIVGQFQIVNHTSPTRAAYHLNSFSQLTSYDSPEGEAPAESPYARHDTVLFLGSGTDNDGNPVTIRVGIKDLGEPGVGVDIIFVNIGDDGTFEVPRIAIDGGNFQVHQLPYTP